MVLRLGLALGQRFLDEDVDRVAVLGVNHDQRARVRCDLHRPEERLVVDHQCALVGHEQLVGGHALVRQRGQLLERPAFVKVGDRHVVAHVDHLLAVGLRAPLVERGAEGGALGLNHEVDVAGRPTERGGGLAGLDVVDRDSAAERHVEVSVGVDTPRQDVLAARVDDLVGLDVEGLADEGDPLVLDEDVTDVVVGSRDHTTTSDQNRHVRISFLN